MSVADATVVCVLTPSGRGAVAVVVVDGDRAVAAVEQYFRAANRASLGEQPVDHIVYGYWVSKASESDEGEDLVVCRRSETRLEVHCHGGSQSSAQIVSDLVNAGCEQVDASTWLQQAHDCLIRAAAHQALSQATTQRAASILLDQYNGALRREIEAIIGNLEANEVDEAKLRIGTLLRFADLGFHLTKPWQVVIAGQPNVGKSSLINALVGFERAIVYDQPGTTRDVVTATTAVEGWPIELSDTAGLHQTDDAIESAGIELARERLEAADLLVWVLDAREVANAGADLARLFAQQAVAVGVDLNDKVSIQVVNKCDLVDALVDHASCVHTSATNGAGIEELLLQIAQRIVPSTPKPGSACVFDSRQVEALQATRKCLDQHEYSSAIGQLRELLTYHV